MNTLRQLAALLTGLVLSGACAAQNATMEVSEAALNKILQRIGVLSDAGVSQPTSIVQAGSLFEVCEPMGYMQCAQFGGLGFGFERGRVPLMRCRRVGGGISIIPTSEPVSWQWWVKDASVKVNSGAMTFTATVRARVGDYWVDTTRTVNALVSYVSVGNAVYLEPASFTVNLLQADGSTSGAGPVQVDRMFRIKLPIVPQTFSVPLPNGSMRSMNGRVLSAAPQYTPGLLKMTFDVGF